MAKPPTVLRRMDPKASLARAIDAARIIFLGEVHHEPDVLGFQTAVIGAASAGGRRPVHVVLEHFACDQQPLLDRFKAGQLSVSELSEAYRSTGTEGFDVEGHYSRLLTYGRDRCRFFGGFLPKREAKGFVGGNDPEVLSARLKEAVQRRYLLPEATRLAVSQDGHRVVLGEGASEDIRCLAGTDSHYYFFESLIMGRGADTRAEEPGSLPATTGRFRKIFSAQIAKDLSMASAVVRVWRDVVGSGAGDGADAKVVAIMGNGHMEYGFGVPERVRALLSNSTSPPGDDKDPAALPEMLHVVCHANVVEEEEQPEERLRPAVFPDGSRRAPADFVYLYDPSP